MQNRFKHCWLCHNANRFEVLIPYVHNKLRIKVQTDTLHMCIIIVIFYKLISFTSSRKLQEKLSQCNPIDNKFKFKVVFISNMLCMSQLYKHSKNTRIKFRLPQSFVSVWSARNLYNSLLLLTFSSDILD